MKDMTEKIKIELLNDEALVLFECLARLDETDSFPVQYHAEELAFWQLHGQLEMTLVEPFDPKYREIIAAAKARLMEKE